MVSFGFGRQSTNGTDGVNENHEDTYGVNGAHGASNGINGSYPTTNGTNGVNGNHSNLNGTNGVNGSHTILNGANGMNGSYHMSNGTSNNGSHQSLNGAELNGRHPIPNGTGAPVTDGSPTWKQEPMAIVGMACRLPDDCHTPHRLWKFLEAGRVAKNTPPKSRYDIKTHYDGSQKNKTMASPGGMFLQDIDPADLDASFFKLSKLEALAMDPQQRQILEVVYEGLENAGVTLEQVNGKNVGCFVASFAVDYADMQHRDPEDRAAAYVVGTGRAMLSNRVSHFLNIKGPSVTVDTACSGSLYGLDIACRYLQTGEISSAIVAGCNMYMSPEWVMDHHMGANGTASLTGKCHTFDAKADGYIKAEAVNMLYIKRLSDAVRDGDAIRAVIRGSAINSDGWTAGIASPNSEAQAQAVRQAYANAGISDLSLTGYVECHGTGTRAGDAIEVKGIASVFGPSRTENNPVRIGSIKSNVGHSEPGAGISGVLKAVLALEKAVIPGNPTFIDPNPNIDFQNLRVLPSRTTTKWPAGFSFRRASVNSFGYGGSNAHVILDAADGLGKGVSSYRADDADLFDDFDDFEDAKEVSATRPYILAFSANDDQSLKTYYAALDKHLSDPSVSIKLRDMAYTLSERRSRHYQRGYTITSTPSVDLQALETGTTRSEAPKLGFVFTGQGAQWPQMGRDLLANFPIAEDQVRYLDRVLQGMQDPPSWTLYDELTKSQSPERLQLPEISQPICTALQLAQLAVMQAAGIKCEAVAGHSSGEIAAAVAAGRLTPAQAIKIAYYRGVATAMATYSASVGMLAAGLGPNEVAPYIEETSIQIACYNSPASVTLSGVRSELEIVEAALKKDGHFARLLKVDAAYHSRHMNPTAGLYQDMLDRLVNWKETPKPKGDVTMYSSTLGKQLGNDYELGPDYWVKNMVSPVLFSQATSLMLLRPEGTDVLVEVGPSNALSGPINQIKATVANKSFEYMTASKRGSEALHSMFHLAGKLFVMGAPVQLAAINQDHELQSPSFIYDLPNYSWNHSTKYWYESEASVDWRHRKFVHHDLLGGKILGIPWTEPQWKKVLVLNEHPWLRDHKLGENVIFPASGYIAMAIEAIFQKTKATGHLADDVEVPQVSYKLRDVTFSRALPLEDEDKATKMVLTLKTCPSTKESWHEFIISSVNGEDILDHCQGRICIAHEPKQVGKATDLAPFQHSTPASVWYKAMRDCGYSFGPGFQRLLEVEATAGKRENRALVSFEIPESKTRQSVYPLHPSAIDSCFQAGSPSLWKGHRSAVGNLMLPSMIDELTILAHEESPEKGIAVANAQYVDVGRLDDAKRYKSNVSVYDNKSGNLVFRLRGLRYITLDSSTKADDHPYARVTWNPDISFLSADRLGGVLDNSAEGVVARIGKLADLIAHKKPAMRILEANLVGSDSFWLDSIRSRVSEIAKTGDFNLFVPSAEASLDARTRYSGGGFGSVKVAVHDNSNIFADVEEGSFFDLLIITISHGSPPLRNTIQDARKFLADNGCLAVLQDTRNCLDTNEIFEGFDKIPTTAVQTSEDSLKLLYLGSITRQQPAVENNQVHLVQLKSNDGPLQVSTTLRRKYGWNVIERPPNLSKLSLPELSTVIVLDELFEPIIPNITDEQYAILQKLVADKCRLLWVSTGGHMNVTLPDRSLFVGVARSLRGEDPQSTAIITLDVESPSGDGSMAAIDTALRHLTKEAAVAGPDHDWEPYENELVERDSTIYVTRILPDTVIRGCEKPEPQLLPLHSHPSYVRLVSDRVGTLDSLHWSEEEKYSDTIEDDLIEVEIHATSLNFKDVANVTGLVPANERQIGLESGGYVTRVGKDIGDKFKPGDRVLISRRDGGCLANKAKQILTGVNPIPDWMSFEDAAAMTTCYATAFYSLLDLAHAQKGETILIHSGAGGVGLATIELAKYLGLEIYVTVGSEHKRKFLREEYGIPEDHMFTSRSIAFAPALMEATNGRGVDILLNALSGDMLHESWRCMANNGRFIEIGKKDMLDRNSLSMEPFTRNASYQAFDLSQATMSDATRHRLLSQTVQWVTEGKIRPLYICKTFSSDQVVDAFRYLLEGKQIGKVVITDLNKRDEIKVPITPAAPSLRLRPAVSYLITGGLKGLCGSLALYLSRQGAKNLVIMARSGFDDAMSQSVVHNLNAMGTSVDLVKGDITNIEDVRRAFKSASLPVAGVIQGAMILRDKVFGRMSHNEFREPIAPKVDGTWNLHNVAVEQSHPLDFFTMLSSISGVVGQAAQTNYSAGNVFQDSFATYRRSLGLPASSVNLGLIEDVGYFVERGQFSKRLESKGWPPINEALLHKILKYSILQQSDDPINAESASQLITGIPMPLTSSSPLQPIHRFSALRASAGASSGDEDGTSALTVLKSASKGGDEANDQALLLASAIEVVNGVLMRSLGASEPLDAGRPLASYGLDSLVAVELRNWVRTELGVEISAMEVVGAKTLSALCEVIIKKLVG